MTVYFLLLCESGDVIIRADVFELVEVSSGFSPTELSGMVPDIAVRMSDA